MKNAPKLSLLITTRDRSDELIRTLSVMTPHLLPEHEVIVFDDGSADGTSEKVTELFPEVKLCKSDRPIGYSAARNILMEKASGLYAISLDDDLEIVSPDFISVIDDHFTRNPGCAVIAFRIYWGAAMPEKIACHEEKPVRVRSFAGGGSAMRLKAWRQAVRYPEWFEFYGEEDNAAMQLLRHGWEVQYAPQVLAHHRVKISDRPAEHKTWRYRRQFRAGVCNMLLFYPWYVLPKKISYAFWAQLKLRIFKERDWGRILDLLWVSGSLVRNFPRIIRERKALSASQWQLWQSLPPSIIYWDPGE